MILVDEALKAREQASKPVRVGLIGAGFMAQGLTNQVTNSVPGMEISAIFNRTANRAAQVYEYAGRPDVVEISGPGRTGRCDPLRPASRHRGRLLDHSIREHRCHRRRDRLSRVRGTSRPRCFRERQGRRPDERRTATGQWARFFGSTPPGPDVFSPPATAMSRELRWISCGGSSAWA